jgi:quercetin dioxygenase-like cupin family protein
MREEKVLENPVMVKDIVEYSKGAIVSKELIDNDAGSVTAFAFDAGQKLSEHSAPFDALVNVIDGEGEFRIGGRANKLLAGQAILMPANIPHAVRATSRFKMILTMICG